MYCSVNVENLISMGLLDKNVKEKYIDLLLKNWTKSLDDEEYGELTMGELRLVKEGIKIYLNERDEQSVLRYEVNDLYWIATDFVTKGIHSMIIELMPQLKEVIDAEPQLEEDEYYYENCKLDYCIGMACGLKQDPCGEFEYNFLKLLHIDMKKLILMLGESFG